MFFSSILGVRQVENLSPSLFSIFLNDHVQFISKSYNGLSTLSEDVAYILNNENIEEYYSSYTCCCMRMTQLLLQSHLMIENGSRHNAVILWLMEITSYYI